MKILLKLSILSIILGSTIGHSFGQSCTGCTVNITSTDTMSWVVPAGMVLCIDAGGTVSGDISITGGEVCNNGVINSTSVAMINGSILTNIGSATITSLAIDDGSVFDNFGNATVVDLAMSNVGALRNYMIFVCTDLGSTTGSTITNDYDMTITGNIGISDTYIGNSGVLVVNSDFATSTSDVVYNTGSMHFKGNLVNNVGCTFYTECVIQVDGDWSNSGTMIGPMTGCGGFNVLGVSANTGSFANDNSNLDMCDLSGIFSGFDVQIGTLGSNVTNCICTNTCSGVLGTEQILMLDSRVRLYPNPAAESITIEIDNATTSLLTLIIYNALGQIVYVVDGFSERKIIVDRSKLCKGLNFYKLSDGKGVLGTGMFEIY